jgi:hypothetical protein
MEDFSTERRNTRLSKEQMLEELADIEHEQWIEWSKNIAGQLKELDDLIWAYQDCKFSVVPSDRSKQLVDDPMYAYDVRRKLIERLKRWEKLQNTPYADLTEEQKEQDRVYARKCLRVIDGE